MTLIIAIGVVYSLLIALLIVISFPTVRKSGNLAYVGSILILIESFIAIAALLIR